MTAQIPAFSTPFADRSVVTIGTFDGVHRGHQALLQRTLARARELGCPLAVVTFDRGLAGLSAEQFIEELHGASGMVELWVGEAFALGRNRSGDIARLTELGDERGFKVVAMTRVEDDGGVISSSRVRQAILDGNVGLAGQLLGRPLTIRGEVVHGQQLGRTIGYPTANVMPRADLVPLADGIYASLTRLPGEDTQRPSMTYVGTRPTVNTGARAIETHLLDFDGDLYGQVIEVDVLHRLRADAQFSGVDELVEQLGRDEDATRQYLASTTTPVD